jgi:hypothetical protein
MRTKISRPWTDEDDRRLLSLSAQGRPHLIIATLLKRTKTAVRTRLSLLRAAQKERLSSEDGGAD